MAATNRDVALAWACGHHAAAGSLHTDGRTIWSYAHEIGYTDQAGDKVAICCHYSMTTAHHCSLVKAQAQQITECSEDYRERCAVYRACVVAS